MQDQIYILANVVIIAAYASVTVAILVPLARAGQLRTNKLAVATALIFFSCAVGHALHAAMSYRSLITVAATSDEHRAPDPGWAWAAALWDVFTAAVGLFYWSLRRQYGVLLGKGAIYVDPWGQRRIDQAGARERAALDVAESHRATLAAVVEHTDDAIIGTSPDGAVTAWNRGAEKLFGYTAEEMLGKPASVLVDESGAAQQAGVLARIRGGERRVHYEARRQHKDGHPLEVAFNVAPIHDNAGTIIGLSLVARDISAAKEAAERQRDLAERSNQAQRMESLGKLAGGVAHDFNNILAIITNYAQFAEEECADRPDVRADLAQVRTAADRATNLTRQLLTFTRGDTAQPRDVDLNAAVTEVNGMLERTIGEHIALMAVPATRPVIVHADPSQIQQVLLNLAINARDAMSDGGTLVLEVNTATLDGSDLSLQPGLPAGTYARVLVSDTGQGIPADVAEHIFEPFYTTKPRGKGTGLGLSTVYGIVTEAGGSIALYSEPGIGTTFRIYLPLVDAVTTSSTTPTTSSALPDGCGRTILVVEDEPALARVVNRILVEGGYRVIAAPNGYAALGLFGEHYCDAVLTDVIMPEMSGPRLVELLHERRPDLPVLYMSGYSNGLLGTTHILDESVALIEKPFTGPGLLHKLHDAMADPATGHRTGRR
jgi:two-component system cell cycle sensor histidine kinase/response regulator CckA